MGDEFINGYIKLIELFEKKAEDKQEQINNLKFEKSLIEDEKVRTITKFMESTLFSQEGIEDAVRSFQTCKIIKEGHNVSDEDLKKFGKLDSKRKSMLESIRTAIFDDSVIKEFDPKLIEAMFLGYGPDSFLFDYKLKNVVIEFQVPNKYSSDVETGCDGKFRIDWKDGEDSGVWNYIDSSYSEKKIRESMTKWINENVRKEATK